MPDFEIITVSSHRPKEWYYCYDEFFRSIAKYGRSATVLGGDGSYKGLISKPKILKRHILGGGVKAKKILFADCWDILFLRDPNEAVELAPDGAVIFNAEKNLFPFVAGDFPDLGTPYRYLNSGFFIGDTEMILGLLEAMNLDAIPDDFRKPDGSMHHENDQEYFLKAYVFQLVPIVLDYAVKLCQTMHGIEESDANILEDGQLLNTTTQNKPVAIHGNGGGKSTSMMQEVLRMWRGCYL